MMAVVCAEII